MDVPIWERSIPFLLLYFAPVIIGAIRRFQGKEKSWPVWALFLVVYLTGWSVIGWLFALRMAFRNVEMPWSSLVSAGGGGGGSPSWTPPGSTAAPAQPSSCMQCNGSGTLICYSCAGRGSWWEAATTAEGSGSPAHCSYCTSSGKLTCGSCGGTGKTRW